MRLFRYCAFWLFLPAFALAKGNEALGPQDPQLLSQIQHAPASLLFIENKGQLKDQSGQARKDIQFSLKGPGVNIFIGNSGLHYQFNSQERPAEQEERFPLIGQGKRKETTPAKIQSYRMDVLLKGANAEAACVMENVSVYEERYYGHGTGIGGITVRTCQKITYTDIYPHIDWVLYLENGQMKYDFVVRPGGDVSHIKLQYKGATAMQLRDKGAIKATTPMGNITEGAPYSYLEESKQEIASEWRLDGNTLSFSTGAYPREKTLIIDPTLEWATYYGGNIWDESHTVTCDPAGNVYIAGMTTSITNIATTGSFQQTYDGGQEAFLVKFNASGNRLWGTYISGGTAAYGPRSSDYLHDVCSDADGNIYICGMTNGTGMATPGSHQPVLAVTPGRESIAFDAYLAKFNNDGVRQWATYYGGNNALEDAYSITCDPAGNVYMTGVVAEENLPILLADPNCIATPGSHQDAMGGGWRDAYLVKFNSAGVRQWGTYYGGDGPGYYALFAPPLGIDAGTGVACDQDGNVYMTGSTTSPTSIATPGSHRPAFTFSTMNTFYPFDAFLVKFNSAGVRQWGTYYGALEGDEAFNIRCDNSNNVYIAGGTNSPSGIASPGAYQAALNGPYDAFVAKFNTAGIRQWGSYYGGEKTETAYGLSSDTFGHVYLAGKTISASGIAMIPSYQDTFADSLPPLGSAGGDGFLVQLDTNGLRQWATYYGGRKEENLKDVVTAPDGSVYLTGYTISSSGIATPGSHRETIHPGIIGGTSDKDGFLAKFNFCNLPEAGIIAPHRIFCPGDQITLTAVRGLGYRYQWQTGGQPIPGATTPVFTTDSSATYTLLVTCPDTMRRDTASITVTEVPFRVSVRDTGVCNGMGLRFQPETDAPDSFVLAYAWRPATGLHAPDQRHPEFNMPVGIYDYVITIRSTGPITCVSSDTLKAEVFPAPSLTALPGDTTICYGDSLTLRATGADYYVWWPSGSLDSSTVPQPVARPLQPTVYTVLGLSENGCRDSATVRVDIDYRMPDYLPNAFSPNGDGLNDVFRVENITYQKVYDFRIFNRWGQEIFTTLDAKKGWDGTVKGALCDIGTYHYYIRLAYPDGQTRTFKGDINLLR